MRRGISATMTAALAAAAATAQTPPAPGDAIDALLRPVPHPTEPRPESPPLPAVPVPEPPPPFVPPPPQPEMPPPRGSEPGPLPLEQTGRSADGPPSASDVAYDERLRASMASAQGLRGPMEGGWSLLAGGRERYVLELADRNGVVEGAWRDATRGGASGFIDAAERTGEMVVLRFGDAVVTLRGGSAGWTGELRQGERLEAATLRRR